MTRGPYNTIAQYQAKIAAIVAEWELEANRWSPGELLIESQGSADHIAEHIKAQLNRRGWSQSQLSREMSLAKHPMHASVISRVLGGSEVETRNISVDQLIGLSIVFECPVAELLIPQGHAS